MHVCDRQLQRFCSQTLAPKQRWNHLNGKLTIFWVLIWPDHIWTLVQVANMSLVCVWPLTTPPQPDSHPIYNWLLSKCFAWLERMGTVSELRLYKSLLSFHYLHNSFFCVCVCVIFRGFCMDNIIQSLPWSLINCQSNRSVPRVAH